MHFSQNEKKNDFLALNVLIAAIVHSQSGLIVSRLQSRYPTTSSTESDVLGFFFWWRGFHCHTSGEKKHSSWRMQILFNVYNKPVEKKGQETYEALLAHAKLFEEKVSNWTKDISSPCLFVTETLREPVGHLEKEKKKERASHVFPWLLRRRASPLLPHLIFSHYQVN